MQRTALRAAADAEAVRQRAAQDAQRSMAMIHRSDLGATQRAGVARGQRPGNTLTRTLVGDPLPAEDALDGDDEIAEKGRAHFEEGISGSEGISPRRTSPARSIG